jgi:hypothetical protein
MASISQTQKTQDENKGKDPMGQAKEMGMQGAEKAKDAAASVADMAGNAASTVGKKADDMAATAGGDIRKWGESLSESAPHEGMLGQASQAVAGTLKEGGRYLEQAKFSGMADDVTMVIKRNPVPAVLIGFSLGFILGRAIRS